MNDEINGAFELLGGMFLLGNVWRLWRDRKVAGVSWLPVAFFTLWGYWNLYFYPSVNCPWSFFGGTVVVVANTWWLALLWWLRWKQ